jgi:hypothetical protein
VGGPTAGSPSDMTSGARWNRASRETTCPALSKHQSPPARPITAARAAAAGPNSLLAVAAAGANPADLAVATAGGSLFERHGRMIVREFLDVNHAYL